MSETTFDIAIVGAGIVGLAHALAAARRGLKGTGQAAGVGGRRARRGRVGWADGAGPAGVAI